MKSGIDHFVLFAVETMSLWCQETISLVSRNGSDLNEVSGDNWFSSTYLIHWGNQADIYYLNNSFSEKCLNDSKEAPYVTEYGELIWSIYLLKLDSWFGSHIRPPNTGIKWLILRSGNKIFLNIRNVVTYFEQYVSSFPLTISNR